MCPSNPHEALNPPEPSGGDKAHAIARGIVGAIPLAGAAGIELFTALVEPPLKARQQEWMESVGDALRELSDQIEEIDLDHLREDPGFIDTLLQASQAALRTSREEKLETLRNAVLNTATPAAPDDALRHLFIKLVDEFTEWHVRVLVLFDDPLGWFEDHDRSFSPGSGSLSHVLTAAYPELGDRRGFYDQVWKDLNNRGLVNTDSLQGILSGHGMMQKRTTDLGQRFLEFIKSPLE